MLVGSSMEYLSVSGARVEKHLWGEDERVFLKISRVILAWKKSAKELERASTVFSLMLMEEFEFKAQG